MSKLSEHNREDAVVTIGLLIEPLTEVLGDPEVKKIVTSEGGKTKVISYVLKKYPTEILQVMAILDGVDIEDERAFDEYKDGVNIFTLPKHLLEIINDPMMQSLFFSQVQTEGETSSTPASEIMQESK